MAQNELITVNGIDYVKSDYDQAQRLMEKARVGAETQKRTNQDSMRAFDHEAYKSGRADAAGGL